MEQNFEVVYDFANLYAAYRATRKGKRWKDAVAKVELNTLEAITVLQAELRDGLYKPGNYHEFYVFEPKRRLIQTNSVKDKIVQHAFCDNILYPVPVSYTHLYVYKRQVVYLDRDSDAVIAGGAEADPNTERLHSGDDAVFVGGIRTGGSSISGLPAGSLSLGTSDGGVYLSISPSGIDIKGNVTITGDLTVTGGVVNLN